MVRFLVEWDLVLVLIMPQHWLLFYMNWNVMPVRIRHHVMNYLLMNLEQ